MCKLLIMLGMVGMGCARAQTPNAIEIQQAMQKIEHERKAIFNTRNWINTPNSFPKVPLPKQAGINPINHINNINHLDLEIIAQQYAQKAIARKVDNLMIFASFTMPKESLKRLVSQAKQVGAAVLLRGFKDNALRATALAIKALDEQGCNVLIHPNAFIKYQIKAVPTVVLARADNLDQADHDGYAVPGNFVAVAGDVSLDYALQEITRHAPQFEPEARPYIRSLQAHE